MQHHCEICEQYKLDLDTYAAIIMSLDFMANSLWHSGANVSHSEEIKQIANARKWVATIAMSDLSESEIKEIISKLN